ncbi:MAG: hypothetical protein LIO77_08750 [Rikenellaceae bacterium]|nr:hypothetical protein [Rikenellaceae bacterium]
MTLRITATAEKTITISFGNLSLMGGLATASIPDITGITISGDTGNVTIPSTDKTVELGLGGLAEALDGLEAKVSLSGSVKDSEELTLNVVVSADELAAIGTTTLTIPITGTKN